MVIFASNSREDLLLRETDLGQPGVTILFRAIAQRANDRRRKALFLQAENRIVLRGHKTFHGTCIDSEQGGARQKSSQGDVGLASGPGLTPGLVLRIDDAA